MADVLGRDVETIENPRQVGAMGAAALLAVSFGLLPDIKDIKKIIKVQAVYHPGRRTPPSMIRSCRCSETSIPTTKNPLPPSMPKAEGSDTCPF